MKLKRMKLVALAMSALMITSALPMTTFAEEDVFFEEVADEALVGESAEEEFFFEDEGEELIFEEEDAEVVVGDGADESLEDEEFTFKQGSVEYSGKDGIFNYVMEGNKGTISNETVQGVGGNIVEATCKAEGYTSYQVTIKAKNGAILYDKEWRVDKTEKKEHVYPDTPYKTDYDEDGQPTCTSAGSGTAYFKCVNCGEEITKPVEEVLEPQGHKLGTFTTEYKTTDPNTKVDANGNVTLIDPQKGGSYDIYKWTICSKCGKKIYIDNKDNQFEAETIYDTVDVLAKEEKYCYIAEVSDTVAESGKKLLLDASSEDGDIIDSNGNLLIPITDIEMTDCSKAGTYTVYFMSGDDDNAFSDKHKGHRISYITFDIDPHHYLGEMGFEFDKKEDLNQVKEVYDAKNNLIGFKNINCSREVTYYEVQHCKATGKCSLPKCNSKRFVYPDGSHTAETGTRVFSEKKIVLPKSTDHIINTTTKKAIQKLVDEYKNGIPFEKLEEEAEKKGSYIKVVDNEPKSCAKGTATVQFICKVCGEVVETMTVDRAAREHQWGPIKREVVQAPTCSTKGIYYEYIECARCGEKKPGTERTVNVPTTPHTKQANMRFKGEVVVDYNSEITTTTGFTLDKVGIAAGEHGAYENFCVAAEAYNKCSVCGAELDKIGDAKIKVVSLKKSQYSCLAGTITLQATYTLANGTKLTTDPTEFPYYTSINAYQGRSRHDPETLADGTVRCKICGTVITEGSGSEEPAAKTPGETTIENLKDATCTEAGSYDLVTKAVEDGSVISTVHVVTPATGHDYGAWVTSKKATVFATGTQKRTCSHCKNVETKSIAKLPSIIKLNKSAVTVKVGKSATVKVSKWNLKDYIAPSAENGVVSANKNVATAFKTGSYTLKIKGKKAGSTTVTVKMKAGATAQIKVTVKK